MSRLIIALMLLLLSVNVVIGKPWPYKAELHRYTLQDIDILEAHMRMCEYAAKVHGEAFCWASVKVLQDHGLKLLHMYLSIVLHESGHFKWKQGKKHKYDYGYSMINTKIWTKERIKQYLGIDIKSTKDLLKNDKLALKIGFLIFYYNATYAVYKSGDIEVKDIFEAYHCPNSRCPSYAKKVMKIYNKLVNEGLL
jgi:hypothetical protein